MVRQALKMFNSEPVISSVLSASKPSMTALSPSDYHILIAEDNLVNQEVLAAQMRKLGCTVYLSFQSWRRGNYTGECEEILKWSRL